VLSQKIRQTTAAASAPAPHHKHIRRFELPQPTDVDTEE
jgi:hypothetical protein